jgi:hypothetical protein
VVNGIEGFAESPISVVEVEKWFDQKRLDRKYGLLKRSEGGDPIDWWKKDLHGAKLLADLFTDLSECRVGHVKVVHSVKLTEWLIANAPNDFDGLVKLLDEKLGRPLG